MWWGSMGGRSGDYRLQQGPNFFGIVPVDDLLASTALIKTSTARQNLRLTDGMAVFCYGYSSDRPQQEFSPAISSACPAPVSPVAGSLNANRLSSHEHAC